MFQIVRVDIHARGGDDDVLSPTFEIQVTILILFCKVTGAEPPIRFGKRLGLAALPVGSGYALTSYENFSAVVNSNFHARKYFADRSPRRMEGVIQTDERSGFRHAISLDHRVSKAIPECLRLFRQSCPAADESPELPAEARVHAAETPPAPQKVLSLGESEALRKLV